MEIRVPAIAEGVETGTVVAVLVKTGDTVKKDQTVAEIETNKAVAQIPATAAGKVTGVHVKEGDTVAVGGLLVTLDGKASAGASESPAPAAPAQAAPQQNIAASQTPVQNAAPAAGGYQYQSQAGAPPPASPSVRKLARELGIDLSRIRGSEAGGRITMGDVRNFIAYLQQAALSGGAAAVPQAQQAPKTSIDFSKWGPIVKKPMSQLRKTIAKAMVDSKTAIPDVTQFDDINLSALMQLRKKYVKDYEAQGAKLTLTALLIKAVVHTLQKNPVFNTSLDEATSEVVYKEYMHIGIAVDTEHGLIVPVIRDADKKSVAEIAKELAALAERARSRTVSIEELQGGTFTISNQGGIGGKHFTPVINKPEVAILGLGKSYEAPVYAGEKLEKQMLLPIGLSYDHRVIDGAKAAKFVVDLAEAIANFPENELALKSETVKAKK